MGGELASVWENSPCVCVLRHFWKLKSARAVAQVMTESVNICKNWRLGFFNSGEDCNKEESLVVLSHDVIFKVSVSRLPTSLQLLAVYNYHGSPAPTLLRPLWLQDLSCPSSRQSCSSRVLRGVFWAEPCLHHPEVRLPYLVHVQVSHLTLWL